MKKALLLAAFVGIAASAQAAVVNMNFSSEAGKDSTGAQNLNGTSWTSSVAPLAYAGNRWNDFKYWLSDFTMLDSEGGSTTVAYNIANGATQTGSAANWGGAGVPTLLAGGLYANGVSSLTMTISGLSSGQYDLYLIGNAANAHSSTFTIGSQSLQTSGSSNTSFIEGDNYVRFSNLTPNAGNIVVTISTGAKGVPVINGFQLANAVPEPTSLAVLGLAGMLVLRRKP